MEAAMRGMDRLDQMVHVWKAAVDLTNPFVLRVSRFLELGNVALLLNTCVAMVTIYGGRLDTALDICLVWGGFVVSAVMQGLVLHSLYQVDRIYDCLCRRLLYVREFSIQGLSAAEIFGIRRVFEDAHIKFSLFGKTIGKGMLNGYVGSAIGGVIIHVNPVKLARAGWI